MQVKRLAGNITEETVYILWEGESVGILARRMNDACEEEYVFRIDWEAWDRIQPYQDITGINMDLRLDEYVRDHVPSFIYDYMPPIRDDTPELLEKLGLDCYDIWDIMIATKRTCRDNFRVALCEKEHPV